MRWLGYFTLPIQWENRFESEHTVISRNEADNEIFEDFPPIN